MPTIAEGLDASINLDFVSWTGLAAPTGTPPAVVARLNAEVRKILQQPEVKDELARLYIDAAPSTPEEMTGWIRSDTEKWARLVKAAGIEPQ